MDRNPYHHRTEHHLGHDHGAPAAQSSASPLPPPTAQPPIQIPFSDPFQANRDPFLPGAGGRRGSLGLSTSRAWPPPTTVTHHHHHHQQQQQPPPQQQPQPHYHHHSPQSQHLPPTQSNGPTGMASSYDSPPRRSSGAAANPPQYGAGSRDAPPPPPPAPSFPTRNMPPPSPPQNAPSSSAPHMTSAPRGPPTTSPFAGVRDITSGHRPGMSISAILGGNEERGTPHSSNVAPTSTPRSMQPPSPGRARSVSMREGSERGMRRSSPSRPAMFGDMPRMASEPRRDGLLGSPQFRREQGHGFRAFQPQEHAHHVDGYVAPMRPNSQPIESGVSRGIDGAYHRELQTEGLQGVFRHYGDPHGMQRPPFQDGAVPHQGRAIHDSPRIDREVPIRYQPPPFGPPFREDPTSNFRPAVPPRSHPTSEMARESIEGRTTDLRRRPSPPLADVSGHRNPFIDRPMTLEEHQRMEMMHREQQHRKESEGSVHRALLNISPELSRRGRNSPLPQAVQGAQSRHIGPGGDNPGIKSEFGRMFSGLGSGVGSATPNPGPAINGSTTPSRMSPSRHLDGGDLARPAVAELDDKRGGSRAGRRSRRRSRENGDLLNGDGRDTPETQRGKKRVKGNHQAQHHHHHVHPHHHHHHHHHPESMENGAGVAGVTRFPSNPLSQANLAASQAHHHHHHHAHPGHHHHYPPRAAVTIHKPSITVLSNQIVEECASKPRKHLGTQLYTTEMSVPPAANTSVYAKIKFSSKMKPIPLFEGRENCTFTVRVPRYYLGSGEHGKDQHYSLEEICKRRQLWGTDIFTDDSDVVAAAVHAGWLKGDFGNLNDDLHNVCDNPSDYDDTSASPLWLEERPRKPVKAPAGYDAHITLLVLPPLESYAATCQHHIWSREWKKPHDGMSYMIHSVEFVEEGASSRFAERGAAARKSRIAAEEAKRREAAAGLLMFANGTSNGVVRVGA